MGMSVVKSQKLKRGKNIFQVANIMAMEGREGGNSAGWSVVVIYKENSAGAVRSITTYTGYKGVHPGHPNTITISGFKLPKDGNVSSKTVISALEGEFIWGQNRRYHRDYDWIKISDNRNSGYQYMPDSNGNKRPNNYDIGNKNNIFDGIPDGVKRDYIARKYNDLKYNNNGIDIDLFDVSKIMKEYRDANRDIDTIYLGLKSNSDYITVTMATFATELYTPKVCYDFNIKLGDYYSVPATADRNFTVQQYNNLPLQVSILLRSEETDFNLKHSKVYLEFTPNDTFEFDHAMYSLPNTYEYKDSIVVNQDRGVVAIGNNPSKDGGTIGAKETMYTRFYYNFKKSNFKGKFDLYLDANISINGVHDINYLLSTNAPSTSKLRIPRCDTNPTYDPIYGMFNIKNGSAKFSQSEAVRYSLKTQVV